MPARLPSRFEGYIIEKADLEAFLVRRYQKQQQEKIKHKGLLDAEERERLKLIEGRLLILEYMEG